MISINAIYTYIYHKVSLFFSRPLDPNIAKELDHMHQVPYCNEVNFLNLIDDWKIICKSHLVWLIGKIATKRQIVSRQNFYFTLTGTNPKME